MDVAVIDKLLDIIRAEPDNRKAFEALIELGKTSLSSSIWGEFLNMHIQNDIMEAKNWIHQQLEKFAGYNGICLGLDTLNMDDEKGYNLEIGLTDKADPEIFDDGWCYDCPFYGESHLIKSLSTVAGSFVNEGQWTSKERSFAEYFIFLGYSGIILRNILQDLTTKNDFLSIWGFHDGDMFFLVQSIKGKSHIVTNIDL